ncbi:hypothetical protein ACF0H5_015970 [Mactra antiquata]
MICFNPQPTRRFIQDRVQTLVNSSSDTDLNKNVKVEGSFIQLNHDGLPIRQVFLAITNEDFIIVRQDTDIGSIGLVRSSDDVISDLFFDEIIPLPLLHFFVIDDRAKRFTVCTSHGLLYHFEMCLLDFCTEQDWSRWRAVIARLTGRSDECFGAKSKRISYVVKIDENIHKKFEATRDKYGLPRTDSLHFIHNPMTFKQVESVGIQTQKGKSKTHNYFNIQDNKEVCKVYGSTPIILSSSDSSVEGSINVSVSSDDTSITCSSTKMGDTLLDDRLKYLYTGNEFWRQIASRDKPRLRRTNSTDNLMLSTCENDDRNSVKHKNIKNSKQLQNWMNQVSELNELRIGKSLLKSDIDDEGDDDADDGDSDDDVDKAFQEVSQNLVKKNKTKRDGPFLWSLAKRLILKRESVIQPQSNRHHVTKEPSTFRKLTSLVPLPPSMTDFIPSDVSSHLTYMSKKLFILITTQDIEILTSSCGQRIPKSISDILKFNDVIVKMVVTETLKANDGISGQIRSLKFFVQVSLELLFWHHDFMSLTAILKGLVSLPLYHMDNLWVNLFVQEPFVFCQFMTMVKLLSPCKRYKAYTSRVETLTKRNIPFIPWLDHILHHCRPRSTEDVFSLAPRCPKTFHKVTQKVKLFENIAKSFRFSKPKVANNYETQNNPKLKNRSNKKQTRENISSKKGLQRKVTFNVKDKESNETLKSAEMKQRAKALWVKRIVSWDEMKPSIDINKSDGDIKVKQADQQVKSYSDKMSQNIIASALNNDITADRESVHGDIDISQLDQNGENIMETSKKDTGKDELARHNTDKQASDQAKSDKDDVTKAQDPKNNTKVGFFERLFSNKKSGNNKSKEDQIHTDNDLLKPVVITVSMEESNKSDEKSDDKDLDDDNNEIDTDDRSKKPQAPHQVRKLSYIPSAVTNERRKSLFEEALETHVTEKGENEAFEALIASRRSKTDARQSGIDLLTIDEDTDYPICKAKSKRMSFIQSVCHLLGGHANQNCSASEEIINEQIFGRSKCIQDEKDLNLLTAESNKNMSSLISKQIRKTSSTEYVTDNLVVVEKTDTNQNRRSDAGISKLTDSLSKDRLDYEQYNRAIKNCGLCTNKQCIYGVRVSSQVMNYQLQLLDMKTSSQHAVGEYFQLVMEVYDCRSDNDILQLSLQVK